MSMLKAKALAKLMRILETAMDKWTDNDLLSVVKDDELRVVIKSSLPMDLKLQPSTLQSIAPPIQSAN